MATTAVEERVIDILVNHPRTDDRHGDPIHAVDAAMGWDSLRSRAFVDDLVYRGLIVSRTEAIDTGEFPNRRSQWWWERLADAGPVGDGATACT